MRNYQLLSIVIPAYNEGLRVTDTFSTLLNFVNELALDWEIIIIDDGSTDNTVDVCESIFINTETTIVSNRSNRGKGYSFRRGISLAKGDLVLLSDADFSTPIGEFYKLYRQIQYGHDIAIGSRALPNSDVIVHQSWFREMMGKLFNRVVKWLGLTEFMDTQCGFKCFSRREVLPILSRMTIDRFSFDVEFLFLAKLSGLSITEVPVRWHNVSDSRVRIIRDSISMLFDLCRIKTNQKLGRYNDKSKKLT